MTALVAVETIVLVLLTVVVTGLLRSHGEILRRLHAMGAGLDPDADPNEQPAVLRPARRPPPRGRGSRPRGRRRRNRTARRRGDDPRRRRAAPHAARVPLERLPDVPRVLGSARGSTQPRPAARRARRRRHQGRGRGEPALAARACRARPRGRDVERHLGALHRPRIAVLRTGGRGEGQGRRGGHRPVVGAGAEPAHPRRRRRARGPPSPQRSRRDRGAHRPRAARARDHARRPAPLPELPTVSTAPADRRCPDWLRTESRSTFPAAGKDASCVARRSTRSSRRARSSTSHRFRSRRNGATSASA